MKARDRIAVVAVLVLAVAGGCSARASEGNDAVAAAAEDPLARRLCDALHTIPARRRAACCAGAPAPTLASLCTRELSDAIERKTLTIAAADVDRCEEAMAARLEGCGWISPLLPELPAACTGVMHGRVAARAGCASSLECADGLYCRGASPVASGVCSPSARPRERCEVPLDNLAGFARARDDVRHPECEGRCVKGLCVAFAGAGAACASSALCAPGLTCAAGRCVDRPLPGVGDACTPTTGCDARAVCTGGRCTTLRDAGEPCRLPFECRSLACDRPAGAAVGTCAAVCGAEG